MYAIGDSQTLKGATLGGCAHLDRCNTIGYGILRSTISNSVGNHFAVDDEATVVLRCKFAVKGLDAATIGECALTN